MHMNKATDGIYSCSECNHFFLLWITLVTEWLEIQFNPLSGGGEEGPKIDKRITQGQVDYLLNREELKERISGLGVHLPCLGQICEPKPTQSSSFFSYFCFCLLLVLKVNIPMDFSNCLAEGEGIRGPRWDRGLRAEHTTGVWRWWPG